jgi:hypothetical protein
VRCTCVLELLVSEGVLGWKLCPAIPPEAESVLFLRWRIREF